MIIGADPEVFVSKDGVVVPVTGLLGGSKDEPRPVENGGAVQEDNVAAEFNTPVSKTEDEFVHNTSTTLNLLKLLLQEQGYDIVIKGSHTFDMATLKAIGAPVMQFGCMPDTNAWTLMQTQPSQPRTPVRVCGGHEHIDIPEDVCVIDLVRRLDLFQAIPGLFMDRDKLRRSMYGGAGSFREYETQAGASVVEYRTLSNFWLGSEELMRWAFRTAERAVNSTIDVPEQVAEIINSHDLDRANELVQEYKLDIVI